MAYPYDPFTQNWAPPLGFFGPNMSPMLPQGMQQQAPQMAPQMPQPMPVHQPMPQPFGVSPQPQPTFLDPNAGMQSIIDQITDAIAERWQRNLPKKKPKSDDSALRRIFVPDVNMGNPPSAPGTPPNQQPWWERAFRDTFMFQGRDPSQRPANAGTLGNGVNPRPDGPEGYWRVGPSLRPDGQDINLPMERRGPTVPRGAGGPVMPPPPAVPPPADVAEQFPQQPSRLPPGLRPMLAQSLRKESIDDRAPAPTKTSGWGEALKGMLDGLPGALVAFAADHAHSPELAQQYTNMKARQLSEIQEKRKEEIQKMQIDAERGRHEASMGWQLFNARLDVNKQAQELQRLLGTSDPEAYSKVITSLAVMAAQLGEDPELFIASFPFLDIERLNTWRDEVNKLAVSVGDEKQWDYATTVDPWTKQRISLRKAMAKVNGVGSDGYAIMPLGDMKLTETTQGDESGRRVTTLGTVGDAFRKPQITFPDPTGMFMQGQYPDPNTGDIPVIWGNARTGRMNQTPSFYLPGEPTGPGPQTEGIGPSFNLTELRAEARAYIERKTGVPAQSHEIGAVMRNPAIVRELNAIIAERNRRNANPILSEGGN